MRVGGILWGRRPPSAGGGPVLRRRPALRAGRRQNPPPFRRFVIANGIIPSFFFGGGRLLKSRICSLNQLNRKPPFPSKTIKALKINAESSLSYLPAIPNFLATHNPYTFRRLRAVHSQYHCARTPSKPLWLHRQNPNARLIALNIGSPIAFRLCNKSLNHVGKARKASRI
jgi:hypothetical protein